MKWCLDHLGLPRNGFPTIFSELLSNGAQQVRKQNTHIDCRTFLPTLGTLMSIVPRAVGRTGSGAPVTRAQNSQLIAVISEFGFTHADLAQKISDVITRYYGPQTPHTCDERTIRRWVRGDVRWPTQRYLFALEQIFRRPVRDMGFIPRGKSSSVPVPPAAATPKEVPVHRRSFISGSAAVTVATTLGMSEVPQRGHISMNDVARVTSRIDTLNARFLATGGGSVVDVATHHINGLRRMLNGCTYSDRVGKALHGAVSSLYSQAGWGAMDNNDSRRAGSLYRSALNSALLADDPNAIARSWDSLAMHARKEGRQREALQIAQASLDNRRARNDPYVDTLLNSRLAIAHALTGNERKAVTSLTAAESAYERVHRTSPPAWLAFLNEAEMSGIGALVHRALGDYHRAADSAAQAITLAPSSMPRSKAYYTVLLAEIQVAQQEHEKAAATITTIDSGPTIHRIGARLSRVKRALSA
ncbi:transcriptional regulator (plasmid) [Streptomyces clavuligerus]|uniref:Transcriptional regulator n=2 Tax=Streptomyces clavuligerus TaxID=1901 RepID=D5SL52_STRCL|nr:transcriptional regulator [Streptomyces clavuligerus]